jgi:Cu2+-exporting ATPase
MNRLPEQCERQKPDGHFETISLKRVQVGEVVRVQPGQAFPADGVLISAAASVDEALLTGESRPITRHQGDTVVAGSFNLAASVLVRVQQLGRDTRFAQIVNLMERASIDKPRLARLADRIAAPFLVVVLLSSIFAGYYWWQIDPTQAVAVAVAVLIVTCPCALSLATPVAMLASAGALAKRGILVRRLQAFESLSQVDTVVFDKTGTLTQDRVVLRHIRVREGIGVEQALESAASLSAASLHPVSRAISAHWLAQSDQSRTSTISSVSPLTVSETPGAGLQAQGHQGQLLRLGSALFCGVSEQALQPQQRAEPDAPCAYLADEHGWLATFIMDEGVRDDAASTLARLHQMGLRTHVLSGDRDAAVQRVARQVGVQQATAQASPEGKLQIVSALQAQGHHIAMVGDGLNDGPVLARAHVSFALGHGAPLTQSQSDFVVQSGRLSEVADTLAHARRTMRIVRQNLIWAASYNAVSIPMALVGWMPPWAAGLGMALSSFLVIGNAMRLSHTSKSAPDSAQVASTTPVLAR